jgi:hypothetical protein
MAAYIQKIIKGPEAVFLVVSDPSMNKLRVT